jgi:hypothetical protein
MDSAKPSRSLSEISHLFLSSVRERQTGGAPRPQRIAPGSARPAAGSVDLTPEEYAHVFGSPDAARKPPQVHAVLATHFNGRASERIREYARHLASITDRVGVIEVDSHDFKLTCFERSTNPTHSEAAEIIEGFDARQMAEAIEELNWDVSRWLLVLPNARTPEARALLRDVEHWTVLCTCDHDGVVSAYRTIKSISDLGKPRLALAVLDAKDDLDAGRIHRKLAGVCGQFLNWPLLSDGAVRPASGVSEHVILHCRSTRDKAQLASATQWQTVTDFLAQSRSVAASDAIPEPERHLAEIDQMPDAPADTQHVADIVIPTPAERPQAVEAPVAPEAVAPQAVAAPEPAPAMSIEHDAEEEPVDTVVDLPTGDMSVAGITSAILAHEAGKLVECPVRPPMCPDARLAVTRERRVVLIAVARAGLGDLRNISQAYRWLTENRQLLAMAVPQLSIDAHALPHLRLIIDHADLSADLLQPILQSTSVTVQAYRKLKWGQKTGLLLEAA